MDMFNRILLCACVVAGGRLCAETAPAAARAANSRRVEAAVAISDAEIARAQAKLKDRCSVCDFASQMKKTETGEIWTAAFQAALDAHEIVVIPARPEPYLVDAPLVVGSNRRIEATGATIRLAPDVETLLLRTASSVDGTLKPIPLEGRADNIAIVGGRWEDNSPRRRGYGASGRYAKDGRRLGNFHGVSTLFYLGCANHVSVRNATFVRCGAFAVQSGDGHAHLYENIRFEDCFADGLHFNGNLDCVHAKDVRGKVGDDLVALNAYDWLNSSINFGPQRNILAEDLELVLKDGQGYPAIRILPGVFRYAEGSKADCAVTDVVFRRVKGIQTFKMYLQTPAYAIGTKPEWAEIGRGGNLNFEDIDIDLKGPIDLLGGYASSDPLTGHYGEFEFGANLASVAFRRINIRFHLKDRPLAHLATVGPKSARVPSPGLEKGLEIFDPYVTCTVDHVTMEDIRIEGEAPQELVYSVTFKDINGDGLSTGSGIIRTIERK